MKFSEVKQDCEFFRGNISCLPNEKKDSTCSAAEHYSMMTHVATTLQEELVMSNIFDKHEFELYDCGEIVEHAVGCVCYYGNSCVQGALYVKDLTPRMMVDVISKRYL